ncbi:Holliday junction branch migration protein RuvA [Saxibacter everestensis]|uniref:Holliday junction branch migration complex subunit RuvA n=1 Tax=Saxibacter everestensis TaxID=2909229 RepID=A0ABY8QXT7_9MICO|nr:Holliday junction branch migration protein RuvA [Brevibacteriaceae bacterium ZFBP1038]
MIASVTGVVASLRLDAAVISVNGIGMLVYAAPGTLAELRLGSEATLSTSLVVREDSLTLYGFSDDDARDVFETLQTISGVGPRLALAMLAVHAPDGLRRAVIDGNLTELMKVPGVGKKGAQRIVLELGDKLGIPRGIGLPGVQTAMPSAKEEQIIDALIGLGWNQKQAAEATKTVVDGAGEESVAVLLKEALKELGRR